MNLNLHDESLSVNGFDELLRPVIFFKNIHYIRWDVFQNNLYKSISSLEYVYVNDLHGTTAQSEMFQERRLRRQAITSVGLLLSFVLNKFSTYQRFFSL